MKNLTLLFLTFSLFSLTLSACDTSEDKPADNPNSNTTVQPDPDAPRFCRVLVAATCERVLACTTGTTQAECLADASYNDCGNTKRVGPLATTCLKAVQAITCQNLFVAGEINLPASCAGVFQ